MTTSHDPKGLIRESYRMESITDSECRSILIDWALSLPAGADQRAALEDLIGRYGDAKDHPMTSLLHEGLTAPPRARGRRPRTQKVLRADADLDATGLLCPLPVLKARKKLKSMQAGEVLCVRATDPAAVVDIPHFCAEAGYGYLGAEDGPEATAYFIRKA